MATEQQIQSSDAYQITSIINHDSNELNDTMKATSPASTMRHSRFFRTKRKQRVNESRLDTNGQNFYKFYK